MNIYLLVCVIAAMAIWLYKVYQRDSAKAKTNQLHPFNDCIPVLQEVKLINQESGFPKLYGRYGEFDVVLELVADTLAVRKLPPLWLLVAIKGRVLTKGSLDIVVRPQNNEFYSPAWEWSGHLQTPENWPAHSLIKYQNEPASLEVLNDFVPLLFSDERYKELLVLPNILRITYLAKQAERGEYMLMRNSLFDAKPLERELVKSIIIKAIYIREALEKN